MTGSSRRRAAVGATMAFLAGVVGVFIGREIFPASQPPAVELHEFLHNDLELDADQRTRLNAVEAQFAIRKRALELELQADNARLADAIETEHGNGPRVRAAVDASHATMGELQKETLAHIFAMRQLLRPDQAHKFDAAVVRALTVDNR